MKNSKKIILAGTVMAGMTTVYATPSLFHSTELGSGDELRTNLLTEINSFEFNMDGTLRTIEAKCGEGKCGEKATDSKTRSSAKVKSAEAKCGEGKCGEGKCGEKSTTKTTDKTSESKCGEGKCGEKSTTKASDKTSESKCGEGKCGEGKCGGK